MTVQTTYFAALDHQKVAPADGDFVASVVRRPADWTGDLVETNIASLAPPEHLLDAYKAIEDAAEQDDDVDHPRRLAWENTRFEQRYREHLTSSTISSVLSSLRQREREGDIWLVCYEKDPRYCHRRLLAAELTRGRESEPVHHPEPSGEPDTNGVRESRLYDFGGETA